MSQNKVKHHFLECASTCIPEKWLLIVFGLAFKKN